MGESYWILNANQIQGVPIVITSLADGNIFAYSSTAGAWINRVTLPATAGVDSVNLLTGAITVTTPNSTMSVGTSGQNLTLDINTANANTWTAVQTFGTNISILGIQFAGSAPTLNQVIQYNGTNWVAATVSSGSSNVTEVANASDTELTATTATTLATFTPTAQGNFMVLAYYRVITAATNLTLTATWDDGSGAQSYTWVNNTSQAVGSYHTAPLYINATTAAAITVTATAGTANQIYASATIIEIT